MKITSRYLVILSTIFVIVVLGFWYLGAYNKVALSSQSIDSGEGADPRPAVESLDGTDSGGISIVDTDELIQQLEQELLKTEHDPDKALEIRRRIQILKDTHQTNDVSVETKI